VIGRCICERTFCADDRLSISLQCIPSSRFIHDYTILMVESDQNSTSQRRRGVY
jgi:hypothetical protein